ncbi:hypothetical protein PG993_002827 [Apiospora rasikravindrae]|uniref:Uncharacterized protein n=1 Tax=Apiospora rasikravindrae TaxID=990691 RepID=A0ABR1TY58_9PEZI
MEGPSIRNAAFVTPANPDAASDVIQRLARKTCSKVSIKGRATEADTQIRSDCGDLEATVKSKVWTLFQMSNIDDRMLLSKRTQAAFIYKGKRMVKMQRLD